MKHPHLLFIALITVLLPGCLSHSSCTVTSTATYQDATLRADAYGLVPTMCGFTSHATQRSTLRATGPGPIYPGAAVHATAYPGQKPYSGKLKIDPIRHRVLVDLKYSTGENYIMNGTYSYRPAR